MGRFTGRPFGFKSLDQELYLDFAQLRAEREKDDNGIIAWVEPLTEKHFFNHQTHHRGQVTTLLSQRGIDPGVTDLIWLPEFQTTHQ